MYVSTVLGPLVDLGFFSHCDAGDGFGLLLGPNIRDSVTNFQTCHHKNNTKSSFFHLLYVETYLSGVLKHQRS